MNGLQQALLEQVQGNLQHGSTQVADQALAALARYTREAPEPMPEQLYSELLELATALADCRPTMAAIGSWMRQWRQEFSASPRATTTGAVREQALRAVERTRDWAHDQTKQTIAETLSQISHWRTVLTHSSSSTVLQVLTQHECSVWVTESRPGLEGRDLALALAQAGRTITYITDAAAASCLLRVDGVLTGADAVLADGAIVNKTGTLALALAARELERPLLVAAERFKDLPHMTRADYVPELQSGAELQPPSHSRIKAWNPYFEAIPGQLVTRLCRGGAPSTS